MRPSIRYASRFKPLTVSNSKGKEAASVVLEAGTPMPLITLLPDPTKKVCVCAMTIMCVQVLERVRCMCDSI